MAYVNIKLTKDAYIVIEVEGDIEDLMKEMIASKEDFIYRVFANIVTIEDWSGFDDLKVGGIY